MRRPRSDVSKTRFRHLSLFIARRVWGGDLGAAVGEGSQAQHHVGAHDHRVHGDASTATPLPASMLGECVIRRFGMRGRFGSRTRDPSALVRN